MKLWKWICLVFLLAVPVSIATPQLNISSPKNQSYALTPFPIKYTVTGDKSSYYCYNQFEFSNDGMVGYWRMDENNGTSVSDDSGNSDTGTYSGETFNHGIVSGATYTSSGKYGGAYSFDGDDDYVEILSNTIFNSTSNITLSAWIYGLDWIEGGVSGNMVIMKGDSYQMRITTTGKPLFYTSGVSLEILQSNTVLEENKWYHLTMVYNGTNKIIFIDGIQDSIDSSSGSIDMDSKNLRIGLDVAASPTYAFNGTIDEVRLWNRALTSSEIQAEMNSTYPVLRPVASYSFETNSASDAYDTHQWVKGNYSSGLSFDGSVNNNISIPDSNSLDFNSSFTVSMWAKSATGSWTTGQNNAGLLYKNSAYSVVFQSTNGLYIYWFNSTHLVRGNIGQPTADTNWHHLAYVWNITDGEHLTNFIQYYDGVMTVISIDYTSAFTANYSKPLFIGDSSNNAFNGTIDEVRIYNRSLSATEVSKLYQASPHTVSNNTLYSTSEMLTSGTYKFQLECRDNTTIYPTMNYSDVTFSILLTLHIDVFDEQTLTNLTFSVSVMNDTYFTNQSNIIVFDEQWYNLPMNDVDIYVSATGYTQRKFTTIISPTSILNITGYLLQSTEGNLVRFHVVDQNSNPITSSTIKAYKYIDFNWQNVEETESDNAGVGTLFLNPLTTYIIEFQKYGYTSVNYTIQPSTQDYTVVLSSLSTTQPAQEELTNITYSIKPQDNVTATNVSFEFEINSFDSKLEWFSFNVTHNDTQLFFNNLTTSSGGNITTIQDLSLLNWNYSVVTYAMFKKVNVSTPFLIQTSYYIWQVEKPSGLTDLVSISNWAKTELNLEHSNPYNKFWFGLGFITLSLIAGAFVSSEGSGFLSLIIIGIGLSVGILSFFPTGTGIIVGMLFGMLCLGYIAYMFMRGGL